MTDSLKTNHISPDSYNQMDFKKKIAVLTFLGGHQIGRRILLSVDAVTLGRSTEASIMIDDTSVSRVHCEIQYDSEISGYRICDLGSANGTFLNDEKISRALLREGDKIIVGRTVLRFSLFDAIDIAFHSEVDKLINFDELTGLVLKRCFEEEFSRCVAVSLSNRTPLSLLMMDMDGLKTVNDTHGHVFGAYSISETGKIIKAAVSSKGLASRFGGDEFMAFLPNTSLDKARTIAEDIRCNVLNHSYEKDNITLNISISIGLSQLKQGDTLESFFKRSDAALYKAKISGRNRVCVLE